jgi:hypothetical protein
MFPELGYFKTGRRVILYTTLSSVASITLVETLSLTLDLGEGSERVTFHFAFFCWQVVSTQWISRYCNFASWQLCVVDTIKCASVT